MMHFRFNSTVFFLLSAMASLAIAEEYPDPTLQLDRNAISKSQNRTEKDKEETPVFISASEMKSKNDGQIEATGAVELRKIGQTIYADRLKYSQSNKDISAEGSVRVEQDNNVILSPLLKFNLDTSIGEMTQPVFEFGDNHARGKAELLQLGGRQDYTLRDVAYTTCPAEQDDWMLNVRELEIDRNKQLGVAHNARVEFMGVPILYTPWMDFALNNQRKSGFLGPVFGSTVQGGNELTLPYYWNISPNLDATISPRLLSKRGLLLNNELRYLQPSYSGEVHLNVLSGDRVTDSTRSLMSLNHTQNFGYGLGGTVNVNRVSDNAYFRDLSDAVVGTSQTNLLREGVLSYAGSGWNIATRVQSFQTLQDPAAPVVEPYRRLPQISVGAQQTVNKTTLSFAGEFVDFHHPTLVSGQRLVLYPGVSYPLISQPAFYLTPKLGLHSTYYAMGENNNGSLSSTSRVLPILSVDSGMMMEREMRVSEQNFVQTLEPRVYYVYIPYRDQNQLPNYDSAQADFSFAQIFTENRFFGSDRIGDANQLTLALTSRLLAQDSGTERFRVAIGQRFSAITPKVNLITPTSTTNKSDILLAASGNMTSAWSLDSTFQYNPNQSQSQQFNAAARYQPESNKLLNLGYRFSRNSMRQMDLSTLWPLTGHWRGVGRWNYSFQDSQILEALGGLEYNQGCWSVRIVAQRFVTATQQVSTGFFVQLELNGLVAVGSDPLATLHQSIPGYKK
jgi:LPS-assembly protein